MLKAIHIKNYKSIKDSWKITFDTNIFVLAGQNESGKSAILEALKAYEDNDFLLETLNFEEEQIGNTIQSISCTYKVESGFIDSLCNKVKEDFSISLEINEFIDIEKLRKLTEYTITKTYDHMNKQLVLSLDKNFVSIIKSAIKERKNENETLPKEEKVQYININAEIEKFTLSVFSISPIIILFNDFSDLLPDKILVSDLQNKKQGVKGYNAVKNLEAIMATDFVSIANSSTVAKKNSSISKKVNELSITFQKDWKQKIYWNNEVKIIIHIENENVNNQAIPTIYFYVQTKDDVPLEPRKRSKGMIRFLSAWLELKAREEEDLLIILYDEPWLYLHIKAHEDILGVFQTLVNKGHQIIYSTHSPSLINLDKLNNIGLVINSENNWTTVEWLTTSKIDNTNKQDALQPIAEAMGLEPLKDFSILSKKNVLLEGLSDFWYFQAMTKLLNIESDYRFVPWIGIKGNHIFHLISFCIWYGLKWLLLMDNGQNPQNTKEELGELLFNSDMHTTEEKIHLLPFSEIENMFSNKDLTLVDDKIKESDTREPIIIIWRKRKIIFAKSFFQKVEEGIITKDKLSESTVSNFENAFKWIELNL